MTTARQDVVAWLRAQLPPAVVVLDSLDALANADRATVMVSRSQVTPAPIVDTRDDGLSVWLISPHVDIVLAEADLDENLDAVLAAFDAHEFLRWESGERDMFGGEDGYHAFRVTVTHRTITTDPEE